MATGGQGKQQTNHVAPTPPQRTPLLWLWLALLLGYPLGHYFPLADGLAPWVLGLSLLLALAGWRCAKPGSRYRAIGWPIFFLASSVLACAVYYQERRVVPPVEWEELPPRELTLQVRVERLFGSPEEFSSQGGIGQILGSSVWEEELMGQRVFFSVRKVDLPSHPARGSVWEVIGVLEHLDAAENDFHDFLTLSGVHFAFGQGRLREVTDAGSAAMRFFAQGSAKLEGLLRFGSEGSLKSLGATYAAILMGNRSLLSEEQKDRYLLTGTMHLFAVSGLHVMAIAGALYYFLLLCRFPRSRIPLVTLPMLFLYVQVTGAPASAVRAFTMVLFHHLALLGVRRPAPLPALAASAVCVLLVWPEQIWNAGFRLSYAVVFTIITFGLPLAMAVERELARRLRGPDSAGSVWRGMSRLLLSWAGNLSAISLAALLASIPLSLYYFGILAPGGLLLNLVLMPLAGLVVVNGLLSTFAGLLGLDAVLLFFNRGAWVILSAMEGMVESAESWENFFFKASYIWSAAWIIQIGGLLVLISLLHASPPQPVYKRPLRAMAPVLWILLGTALWCRPVG